MGSGFLLFEYLNAWKMLIPLAPLRFYLDLGSPPDWDPGRDPAPLSADFTIVVVFLDVCERCSWCRGRGGAPRPNACVLSPNLFLAPLVRGRGRGGGAGTDCMQAERPQKFPRTHSHNRTPPEIANKQWGGRVAPGCVTDSHDRRRAVFRGVSSQSNLFVERRP